MNRVFRYAFWKIQGVKVYCLVGKSGTGKSFRAQFVAEKYHIPLIIDDGLLIKGEKIIAGATAKQEPNFLTAVKRALFVNEKHQDEVIRALQKEKYHKILIIGTSEKMITKICTRLKLPPPEKIIKIEDVATSDEIETALRIRYAEGKHVIPVPPIQITRNYPQIVYDSIKIALVKRFGKIPLFKRDMVHEKTLVRPEFSKTPKSSLTEAAFRQMVTHCMYEYDQTIKVERVHMENKDEGFYLNITLRTPEKKNNSLIPELSEFISDSLEKYGGIRVSGVDIDLQTWN